MCLAIPGKLLEISQDSQGVRMGKANFGGIVKQVCLEYTPEVQTGDYVLVHVGFALSKVDEAEAARTYAALEEMKQLGELDVPDLDDNPFLEEQSVASPSQKSATDSLPGVAASS
jgi:hydrogenase expression/formation protein HypC